jgi:hypothetical protein
VNIYAGPLLPTFAMTVESMRRNPNTHWILVHLGEVGPELQRVASSSQVTNFQFVQATPEELIALALETLPDSPEMAGMVTLYNGKTRPMLKPVLNLSYGYKLNDWKPYYGRMFRKWIKDCTYWGYWDLVL